MLYSACHLKLLKGWIQGFQTLQKYFYENLFWFTLIWISWVYSSELELSDLRNVNVNLDFWLTEAVVPKGSLYLSVTPAGHKLLCDLQC